MMHKTHEINIGTYVMDSEYFDIRLSRYRFPYPILFQRIEQRRSTCRLIYMHDAYVCVSLYQINVGVSLEDHCMYNT